MTKKDICKVELISIWGPNPTYEKLPLDKMKKEYHKYCPKSKSNNLVFCPKSIIKKKKDVRVQWINDYFKNFGKKSKKRRKKRGKNTRKESLGERRKVRKKGRRSQSGARNHNHIRLLHDSFKCLYNCWEKRGVKERLSSNNL